MGGTAPTFYKIRVTKDLLQHVAQGTYPPNPIHVTSCQPPALCTEFLPSQGEILPCQT